MIKAAPAEKREPAHPSLLDMKAHGLTRENAARIVQRHATAAPVVAERRRMAAAARRKRITEPPEGLHASTGPRTRSRRPRRRREACTASSSPNALRRPETAPTGRRPVALRAVLAAPGCLLADEMGLGKTATCLASLAVLMGIEGSSARPTQKSFRSVVCCPAGVQRTWASEASNG